MPVFFYLAELDANTGNIHMSAKNPYVLAHELGHVPITIGSIVVLYKFVD